MSVIVGSGFKDRSGTITAGGAAQNALTQNAGRAHVSIFNVDTGEDLWVSFVGTAAIATQGSIKVPPGSLLVYEVGMVPSNALSVIAATTGHKFTIWEG